MFTDKTACKPAGPDHLSDNPGEHLQGHQNYILEVAMETDDSRWIHRCLFSD